MAEYFKDGLATGGTDRFSNEGVYLEFFHVPTNSSIKFKAFLTNYSETFDTSFDAQEVYGRMDPITIYKGTKRTISLGWDLVAETEMEAYTNLQRVQDYIQMMYPRFNTYDYGRRRDKYSVSIVGAPPLVKIKFMKQKIRKVVIPAAGYGTRFLPATKAMPKEMLPIVDKPIIQYVAEEAVKSGIETIVIVTGWHKRTVEDHFDYPFELEMRLKEAKKKTELKEVRKIADMANFIYVRQKGPYGNATPVLSAQEAIGNEPFAVLWGDEFIYAQPPRLKQMISVFNRYQGPVISAVRVGPDEVSRYGIARIKRVATGVHQILEIVEKPKPKDAPSNLATHGGYILPPEIFPAIKKLKPGKGGEIWLIDAINEIIKKRPVYACEIKKACYYDASNKLGFLRTNIEFGLKHPRLKKEFRKYLKSLK